MAITKNTRMFIEDFAEHVVEFVSRLHKDRKIGGDDELYLTAMSLSEEANVISENLKPSIDQSIDIVEKNINENRDFLMMK